MEELLVQATACLSTPSLSDGQRLVARRLKAKALRETGRFTQALDETTLVVGSPLSDSLDLIELALDQRWSGRYAESLNTLESYRRAVHEQTGRDPIGMKFEYHLGWTLLRLGRYDEAVQAFGRGLESQPGWYWANLKRAEALLALGRVDEARQDARRFADLWPAKQSQLQESLDEIKRVLDATGVRPRGWPTVRNAAP